MKKKKTKTILQKCLIFLKSPEAKCRSLFAGVQYRKPRPKLFLVEIPQKRWIWVWCSTGLQTLRFQVWGAALPFSVNNFIFFSPCILLHYWISKHTPRRSDNLVIAQNQQIQINTFLINFIFQEKLNSHLLLLWKEFTDLKALACLFLPQWTFHQPMATH